MMSTRSIRSPISCSTAATLRSSARPTQLEAGQVCSANLKAPVKMMVGEHDWFLDLGEKWQELFGRPTYSFDWKGVHVVVLHERAMKRISGPRASMTPAERMQTVAGLDNRIQSRFEVGEQTARMAQERSRQSAGHHADRSSSPTRRSTNTTATGISGPRTPSRCRRFSSLTAMLTVIHGHTHQILHQSDRQHQFLRDAIDRMAVALCAPRAADAHRADESRRSVRSARRPRRWPVDVNKDGLADMIYNLWDRNPVTVPAQYLRSQGKVHRPPAPQFASY